MFLRRQGDREFKEFKEFSASRATKVERKTYVLRHQRIIICNILNNVLQVPR